MKISRSALDLCSQSYHLTGTAFEPSVYRGSTLAPPLPPEMEMPASFMSQAAAIPNLVDMIPWLDSRPHALNLALRSSLANDGISHLFHLSSDEVIMVIDSGASISITNQKSDFTGSISEVADLELKGIASGLNIQGVGSAVYHFLDDSGVPFEIEIPEVLYVPDCPVRLLCPQQIARCGPHRGHDGFFIGGEDTMFFYGNHCMTISYHPTNNLPMVSTAPGFENFSAFCEVVGSGEAPSPFFVANTSTTAPSKKRRKRTKRTSPAAPQDSTTMEGGTTDNLKPIQREFMLYHHRYGHTHFDQLRRWARLGIIPKKFSNVEAPVCKACAFADAKKKAASREGRKVDDRHDDAPGAGVSVDTMEAGTPGLLPSTAGLPPKARYNYCTLYVDHFSRFIYVHMHEFNKGKDAVLGKAHYERFAGKYGVSIHHIHADNGIFTSKEFIADCDKNKQTRSFCGVGAHWQNGIVERYIGVITTMARKYLLHAQSLWSSVITAELWPYCVQQAVNFHNVCIREDREYCPFALFTGEDPPFIMNDFHVWGCPVYVTDKRVQDSNHIGRWEHRSRQCVYVGHSRDHGNNVYLVWDPVTKHVSPQYHLIFDDKFTTVAPGDRSTADMNMVYDTLFADESNHWTYHDDFDDAYYFFDKSVWSPPADVDALQHFCSSKSKRPVGSEPKVPPSNLRKRGRSSPLFDHEGVDPIRSETTQPVVQFDEPSVPSMIREGATETTGVSVRIPSHAAAANAYMQPSSVNAALSSASPPVGAGALKDDLTYACSSSTWRQPQDAVTETRNDSPSISGTSKASDLSLSDSLTALHAEITDARVCFQAYKRRRGLDPDVRVESIPPGSSMCSRTTPTVYPVYNNKEQTASSLYEAMCLFFSVNGENDPSSSPEWNDSSPLAFAAVNNVDVLTQSQMKKASDRAEFEKAQVSEIAGLMDQDVFEFVHISDVPRQNRLLNAIWSYRRKKRPDGTLVKHKARICADGSQQQYGIDYFETFAPTVAWSTVRLVLCLSNLLNLHGRQIDYVQAFPQADLNEPVYMRIPEGWEITDDDGNLLPDMAIKLKKNLYGTKNASRNWFLKLKAGLEARGFKASAIDPCLFMRDDCLIVLYTDDCLCFSPDPNMFTQLIADLRSDGFLLTDEGDIEDFLGVRITRNADTKQIMMTQTGLIDQVLDDLNLSHDSRRKFTPANSVLHADPEGAERQEPWNYRSVIGKMSFLAQMTRPDIAFAVHQCARWSNGPRLLHEKAVKYIGRYLLATRDKGIILTPSEKYSLDAFVDSDFAGLWHRQYAHMRDAALSRMGYVITFCGCPIYWKSKLASEIALSTTEAEYMALSACLRELLPMRTILKELSKNFCSFDLDSSNVETLSLKSQILPSKPLPSTIHEDNAGCVVLAQADDQYRPRTKHIGIKFHHFKDAVRRKEVSVVKISTTNQWADIFTKPLARPTFEFLRRLMMGW